jgi:hypothetical protein
MMKKAMKKLAVLTAILAVLAGCGNPAGGAGPVPEPPPEPPDLWDGETIAEDFAGGSGSEAAPYIIRTGAQLAYLAKQVNADEPDDYEDEYFTLARDLDLAGQEWTAIGTNARRFKGTFDGKGHVISGLRINKPDTDFQGLFGALDGAEICNLGLEDVAITGKSYVGGIAGYVSGGSIDNSYSTGTVSGTGGWYIGGIAGYVVGNSSITGSYSTGAVSGSRRVGGIAGYVVGNSSIDNSYSTGAVSGGQDVGGIAGAIESSRIENSYNTGAVSETGYIGYAGGIVGYGVNSSIENSYSTGTVSGSQQVGGIAGDVADSSIENSYSTGTVSGSQRVGGIAGEVYSSNSSSVENCAALNPSVTATSNYAGRVTGYISGSNTFTGNVAWDEMAPGAGGVPFTTTNTDYTGTDISKGAVQDGTGFPFDVNEAPWIYEEGKLPILDGLEGQDDTLPDHLALAP